MRKFIITLIFVLILSQSAFCHPPTNIEIKVSGTEINIIVAHAVDNPEKHFITSIDVAVNGKEMIIQGFSLQADKNAQKATYTIPSLKKGDKIQVEVKCNHFGELKKKIIVE